MKKASKKTDYRSFSFKQKHTNPITMRVLTGFYSSEKHFSQHYFKPARKMYSVALYIGFNTRKKKWADLTPAEKKKALSRQWYVRWSYRNPKTGRMQRQENIYGEANSFKTYQKRMAVLRPLKVNLEILLQNGHNPYGEKDAGRNPSSFEAIDAAMEIKRLHMKPESFVRFKSDINRFKKYLKANGFDRRFITSITRKDIQTYLNECLETVSHRTRNNYRTTLGTLWQCMEDEGMVDRNIVKSIKMIKAVPKKNRPFTQEQFNEIVEHLEKHDRRMLLVFYFVTYSILRPKEVCRLDVGCFDLPSSTLRVETKGGEVSTRLVPSIMMEQLPDLSGYDPDVHIIGRTGILEKWDIRVESKRGRISDRFREVKKALGLNEEYGLYSGRHYAITKMYKGLRKQYSPFHAKSELMLITGHKTMAALEKYLREIGAELPADYSKLIE